MSGAEEIGHRNSLIGKLREDDAALIGGYFLETMLFSATGRDVSSRFTRCVAGKLHKVVQHRLEKAERHIRSRLANDLPSGTR